MTNDKPQVILARLDERTLIIHDIVKAQEKHLSEINGRCISHAKYIAELYADKEKREENHLEICKGKKYMLWLAIAVIVLGVGGGALSMAEIYGLINIIR